MAKILVIDDDPLRAEAVVSGLCRLDFLARFALPVTVPHVRDLVSWAPEAVLVDLDSLEHDVSVQCVATMSEAGIPVAAVAGAQHARLLGDWAEEGIASVVERGSSVPQVADALHAILARTAAPADGMPGPAASERPHVSPPMTLLAPCLRPPVMPGGVWACVGSFLGGLGVTGHACLETARTRGPWASIVPAIKRSCSFPRWG
jgi:hypothetical protein